MRLGSNMSRIRRTTQELHEEAKKHIAAARAFHTVLIAQSQKHLHVLAGFTRHIDVLREERRHAREKLASVQACCQELASLRRLRQPWRDTYEDLRRSLSRARALLQRILNRSRKRSGA